MRRRGADVALLELSLRSVPPPQRLLIESEAWSTTPVARSVTLGRPAFRNVIRSRRGDKPTGDSNHSDGACESQEPSDPGPEHPDPPLSSPTALTQSVGDEPRNGRLARHSRARHRVSCVEWPLLADVPPEDVRQLLSVARRRTFSRNEVVVHRGDPADSSA